MKIEYIKVGYLETNCYIIEKQGDVLVIDPGDEIEKIMNAIGERNVIGIIITHHHPDHVGAMSELAKRMDAKVYDIHNMREGKMKIGDFSFECIYAPGHKEDEIAIYFEEEKALFAGDFLFRGTIGRCDLPGGCFEDMLASIENILNYPDNTFIYPGHGEATTMREERRSLESYRKHF